MLVKLFNLEYKISKVKECNDYCHAIAWIEHYIKTNSKEWNYHNTQILLQPLKEDMNKLIHTVFDD